MKRVLLAGLLIGVGAGIIPPAFGQQPGPAPIPIGGTLRPPAKIKDFAPVYPPEAQRARISGSVILETIIGEDGKVRSARVLRSIPELDQAALDAVQKWEYTPTLMNGVAVPVVMTVTVNFSLQGPPGSAAGQLPALPPNTVRLLVNRGANGRTQVWEIELTKAASLPQWNTAGDPPVSVGEAARLAGSWLIGHIQQGERLVLQSANLQRRPLPMDAGFWFYQLVYLAPRTTEVQAPPLFVVVLLDGSILEPKEVTAAASQPRDPPAPAIPPGVTPPRVIRQVNPTYTPEAMRQKISGSVLIQGIVGVDGAFHNLQVVRSLDTAYGLDDAALKAASQWRFTPGMKDGQAVPVAMTVELSFSVR